MSRPNKSELEWFYIKGSLYNNCNTFTMAKICYTFFTSRFKKESDTHNT